MKVGGRKFEGFLQNETYFKFIYTFFTYNFIVEQIYKGQFLKLVILSGLTTKNGESDHYVLLFSPEAFKMLKTWEQVVKQLYARYRF